MNTYCITRLPLPEIPARTKEIVLPHSMTYDVAFSATTDKDIQSVILSLEDFHGAKIVQVEPLIGSNTIELRYQYMYVQFSVYDYDGVEFLWERLYFISKKA